MSALVTAFAVIGGLFRRELRARLRDGRDLRAMRRGNGGRMTATHALSTSLSPRTLALLCRYVRTEDAKNEHVKTYPEWWAEGSGNCGDGSEASEAWAAISYESVGANELLEAVREIVSVSERRCVLHEDCIAYEELARACVVATTYTATHRIGAAEKETKR